MEIVHHGFDAMDVAFQGALSGETRRALAMAKAVAVKNAAPELIELGGVNCWVHEMGIKHGYLYQFDTGPDGEIWTVKNSSDPQQWNIRVTVRAVALAVNGLQAVKARLFEQLEAWGGKILDESIARVDYAVDFVAPEFVLDPMKFSFHSHSTSDTHYDADGLPEGGSGFFVKGRGDNVTGVTVGKMPGRQIIVYDKRREVIQMQKNHWFEIWGVERDDCPKIWRVEVRAGKKHLQDWNIRRFEELERGIGDVFDAAFAKIRMVEDRNVSNISRAKNHPMWTLAAQTATAGLEGAKGGAVYGRITEGRRRDIQEVYRKQIIGLAVGYMYAKGRSEVAARLEMAQVIRDDIHSFSREFVKEFERKYGRVKKRLFFLDDDQKGAGNGFSDKTFNRMPVWAGGPAFAPEQGR